MNSLTIDINEIPHTSSNNIRKLSYIPKPRLVRSQAMSLEHINSRVSSTLLRITPDMDYGLESVSCELAYIFYNKYRNVLIHLNSRREVEKFFITKYKELCPLHLIHLPRHTSQILFALSNYFRVCQIKGTNIMWYLTFNIPLPPRGYPNQQNDLYLPKIYYNI